MRREKTYRLTASELHKIITTAKRKRKVERLKGSNRENTLELKEMYKENPDLKKLHEEARKFARLLDRYAAKYGEEDGEGIYWDDISLKGIPLLFMTNVGHG